ncbi:MAG: hypothetical protein ACSI46_12030 [Gloeotrichia echinulata DVL01]|jgi:hypothetical protein|nr:hypothetical protein [Gloeotrichia echinulata DEX184]
MGHWGLEIGDCTSGADATRSLLPRSGTAPLCYQGLGIGDWGLGIGDWGLGIGDWGLRDEGE